MALKTIPFDAAKHFESAKAQAELITDALETGNAGYIAAAIRTVARARGMAKVAREAGVTRAALYKALSAPGDPQLTMLLGVLRAMGFRLSAQLDNVA